MFAAHKRVRFRSGRIWLGILIGAVGVLLALGLIAAVVFLSMGRCPMCGSRMMGKGTMYNGDMPESMMSRGTKSNMMEEMDLIHTLLANHGEIHRSVEDIPGGIRAETTSEDPEIAKSIRTHVSQMKQRMNDNRPVRMMDPLFREIFEHHDQIDIEIKEVPGGVQVTETSQDPQVTLLIRQHARRAVSEFVQEGMPRAIQTTPLPDGYRR